MTQELWGFPFLLVINREHSQPSVDTLYCSFPFFRVVLSQSWVVSSHIRCDLYLTEYLRATSTKLQNSGCSFLLSSTLVASYCLHLPTLSASSPQLKGFAGLFLGSPSLSHARETCSGSKVVNYRACIVCFLSLRSHWLLLSDVQLFKTIVSYILFRVFLGRGGVSRKRVIWVLFLHID